MHFQNPSLSKVQEQNTYLTVATRSVVEEKIQNYLNVACHVAVTVNFKFEVHHWQSQKYLLTTQINNYNLKNTFMF